jgi:hypothetical protein
VFGWLWLRLRAFGGAGATLSAISAISTVSAVSTVPALSAVSTDVVRAALRASLCSAVRREAARPLVQQLQQLQFVEPIELESIDIQSIAFQPQLVDEPEQLLVEQQLVTVEQLALLQQFAVVGQ